MGGVILDVIKSGINNRGINNRFNVRHTLLRFGYFVFVANQTKRVVMFKAG